MNLSFFSICLKHLRLLALASIVNGVALLATASPYYYVDVRNLGAPWNITIRSLQAIANQNSPQLFLLARDEDQKVWLPAMEAQLGENFQSLSPLDAFNRFGAGAPEVIFDSSRPWTIDLATTMAGFYSALVTDRDLRGRTVYDFRPYQGGKLDTYRWMINLYLPFCNQQRLAYLDDSIPSLRDFAIQQRAFAFDLDPFNSQEAPLFDEILAGLPAQTCVFGWMPVFPEESGVGAETYLVNALSQAGDMVAGADYTDNLSFYDQVTPTPSQLKQMRLQRSLTYQSDKKYVLLIVSDGDNTQFDLGQMANDWLQDRPAIPLAWTISPQLALMAPAVLQTYYIEAAARGGWDEFIAGPSGLAYAYPSGLSSAGQLASFLQSTKQACGEADLQSVAVLDNNGLSPALFAYAQANLDAIWLIAMPPAVGVYGQTAFLGENCPRLYGNNAAQVASAVNGLGQPFALVYVDGWSFSGQALRDFANTLNGSCVIVSATEMASLMRQHSSSPQKAWLPCHSK